MNDDKTPATPSGGKVVPLHRNAANAPHSYAADLGRPILRPAPPWVDEAAPYTPEAWAALKPGRHSKGFSEGVRSFVAKLRAVGDTPRQAITMALPGPGLYRVTQHTDETAVERVKITDAALLPDATEADSFIIDAAMQCGFEIVDDDGDAFLVTARDLVAFVKRVEANPRNPKEKA